MSLKIVVLMNLFIFCYVRGDLKSSKNKDPVRKISIQSHRVNYLMKTDKIRLEFCIILSTTGQFFYKCI